MSHKLPKSGYFCTFTDVKVLFSPIKMFKAIIFILYFIDLHKKQELIARNAIVCVTYHFITLQLITKFIRPFAFTFQETFIKNRCLKPHCAMYQCMCILMTSLVVEKKQKIIAQKQRYGVFLGLLVRVNVNEKFD